jgi:3-oxoacyl-[acyl-carrier protein] reductase
LEVVADLTKNDDCKRLIESTISKFGKLDILVNNAGAGAISSIKVNHILIVFKTLNEFLFYYKNSFI